MLITPVAFGPELLVNTTTSQRPVQSKRGRVEGRRFTEVQNRGYVTALATLTLALAAAGAAAAGEPPLAPVDGARAASGRCEGSSCGSGVPNASADLALRRECERAVSVIGPVSRYRNHGRELSQHDLAQCNRRATRPPA